MWLSPTPSVDSDAPGVISFARAAVGSETDPVRRAVRLYYATRDSVTVRGSSSAARASR